MKILIIKPGGIGDTLLLFPVLAELARRHPDARIDAIGNRAALALFVTSGHIASARSMDDRLATRLLMCADDDAIAHLRGYDRLICLVDDADGAIARHLHDAGMRDFVIASSRQSDTRMPQWKFLLQRCGIEQTMTENEYCSAFARGRAISTVRSGIVIHPGSGSPLKNWPGERFCELMERCLATWDDPITLLLGYAEEGISDTFERFHGNPRVALSVAAPLGQLLPLYDAARAYVGNDSGMAHLAGLSGLPLVALFGPSDPVIWKPIGSAVTTLRAPAVNAVLSAISTDAVFAAVRHIIDTVPAL